MADFTFAPLTPASLLDRSVAVFAERVAVVDGDLRLTYAELAGTARALAGGLGIPLGVDRDAETHSVKGLLLPESEPWGRGRTRPGRPTVRP